MGGLAIVGAAVVGYLAAHVRGNVLFTRTGLLVMGCIVGAGLVGLLDDWIKVTQRAQRRALEAGQDGRAAGRGRRRSPWRPCCGPTWRRRCRSRGGTAPAGSSATPAGASWAVLLIYATTNGVNLTDGLDGLAAGLGDPRVLVPDGRSASGPSGTSTRTRSTTPSTSPWWPRRWSAPAPGSCGGTPRPRGSSWATPARSRSAPAWPRIVAHPQRAAAAPDRRRALRHRVAVGDPAGGQLPALQAAHLPHGADPPPLRARRLAGDHGDRALLAARRRCAPRSPSASTTPTSSARAASIDRPRRARASASPARPCCARSSPTARGPWRSTTARPPAGRALAEELGVELVEAPDAAALARARRPAPSAVVPEPRRARPPPAVRGRGGGRRCRCCPSSTSPPAGTTGRSSPSPAPTARRRSPS